MKKLFLAMAFCGLALFACSQTTEEWLQQKQTALRYLGEQILALNGYAEVLGEGYGIVQKGTGLIGDLKGEDLSQHQSFFHSLYKVNPSLQHHSKTGACLALQVYIDKVGKGLLSEVQRTTDLRLDEKTFIRQVVEALLYERKEVMKELAKIMHHQTYGMRDNERLERLNRVYNDLLEKRAVLLSLKQQTSLLISERMRETKSIDRLNKIHATK